MLLGPHFLQVMKLCRNDIKKIDGIHELNIGHAIVAKALFIGWENAVIEMKKIIKEYAQS